MLPINIRCFFSRLAYPALSAAIVVLVGCEAGAPTNTATLSQTSTAAALGDPDKLLVVDCLLPGQIRKLGTSATYVSPRRPARTTAIDCEIRGGEYVAYDRADYATSLKVWLPQAQSGDAAAQVYVGEIYEKGLGIAPDYALAAQWYRKAADQGNSRAQINLGALYERGLGVTQDKATAINWYRKASGLTGDQLAFTSSLKTLEAERAAAAQTAGANRQEIEQLRRELERTRAQIEAERNKAQQTQQELERARQRLQNQSQTPPPATPTPAPAPKPVVTVDRTRERELARLLENEQKIARAREAELAAAREREALLRQKLATSTSTPAPTPDRSREKELAQQLAAQEKAVKQREAELKAERAAARERENLLRQQAGTQDRSREKELAQQIENEQKNARERETQLQAELTAARERETNLTQQLDSQNSERETLRQQLAALQKEQNSREEEQRTQQTEIARLQAEIATQKTATTAASSTTVQELEQALAAKNAELTRTQQQIAALETEVGLRQENLRKSQTQEQELKEQVSTLSRETESLQQQVGYLQEQRVSLRDQLKALQSERDAQQQSLQETQAALEQQKAATVQDSTERQRLEQLLKEKSDELAATQARITEMSNREGELELAVRGGGAAVTPTPAVAATPEPQLPSLNFGRYYALVIGNDNYKNFPNLKTAVRDAKEVGDVLRSRYGFEVKVLTNVDRYTLLSALNEFRGKLTENDNFLLYYAGHGELANDRGYWLPVDADPDNTANWISNQDITEILDIMSAKHAMVIADSCYSGTLTRSVTTSVEGGRSPEKQETWFKLMINTRSRTVLTSGGLQPVLDSGGGDHSLFTNQLLTVLRGNANVLESPLLFRQVAQRVKSAAAKLNVSQDPQYSPIKFAGDLGAPFFFRPVS